MHALQYLVILHYIVASEKREDLYQSYNKTVDILIQEEICTFMTHLINSVHDGYLAAFSDLMYRLRANTVHEYLNL